MSEVNIYKNLDPAFDDTFVVEFGIGIDEVIIEFGQGQGPPGETYIDTELRELISSNAANIAAIPDTYNDTALAGRVTANELAIADINVGVYDDTALSARITANANAIARGDTYDDSAIRGLITSNTIAIGRIDTYDDTALSARVTANKVLIDAIEVGSDYDDDPIRALITTNKNAIDAITTYDDSDLRALVDTNRIANLGKLNSNFDNIAALTRSRQNVIKTALDITDTVYDDGPVRALITQNKIDVDAIDPYNDEAIRLLIMNNKQAIDDFEPFSDTTLRALITANGTAIAANTTAINAISDGIDSGSAYDDAAVRLLITDNTIAINAIEPYDDEAVRILIGRNTTLIEAIEPYDDTAIKASINLKANISDTYTQTQVNILIDDIPSIGDITDLELQTLGNRGRPIWGLESSRERTLARELKANVSDVYTQTQVNSLIADIPSGGGSGGLATDLSNLDSDLTSSEQTTIKTKLNIVEGGGGSGGVNGPPLPPPSDFERGFLYNDGAEFLGVVGKHEQYVGDTFLITYNEVTTSVLITSSRASGNTIFGFTTNDAFPTFARSDSWTFEIQGKHIDYIDAPDLLTTDDAGLTTLTIPEAIGGLNVQMETKLGGTSDHLIGLVSVTRNALGSFNVYVFLTYDTHANALNAGTLLNNANGRLYDSAGVEFFDIGSNNVEVRGSAIQMYVGFNDQGGDDIATLFISTYPTSLFFTGDPADILIDELVKVDVISTFKPEDITTDDEGVKTLNLNKPDYTKRKHVYGENILTTATRQLPKASGGNVFFMGPVTTTYDGGYFFLPNFTDNPELQNERMSFYFEFDSIIASGNDTYFSLNVRNQPKVVANITGPLLDSDMNSLNLSNVTIVSAAKNPTSQNYGTLDVEFQTDADGGPFTIIYDYYPGAIPGYTDSVGFWKVSFQGDIAGITYL